ncbi:MAG: S24/S26 family peptidase [Planctomycetota bacterium]
MPYSKPVLQSEPFRDRIRQVASGSMRPTLYKDDIILIERPTGGICPGDIIVFLSTDGIEVCHRVTAILPNGDYVTRGDGTTRNDPAPVPPGRLVGRAAAVLRNRQFVDLVNGADGLALARVAHRRRRLRSLASKLYSSIGRPFDRFRNARRR